jgi:hypothetical protein
VSMIWLVIKIELLQTKMDFISFFCFGYAHLFEIHWLLQGCRKYKASQLQVIQSPQLFIWD